MKEDREFLGIYLEKDIKRKLSELAKQNKRSVSAEAGLRIELSMKEKKEDDKNK